MTTSTSNVLKSADEITAFIREHANLVGDVVGIDAGGYMEKAASVHLHRYPRNERLLAGDLIGWFYLLDNPRIAVHGRDGLNVNIVGKLNDIKVKVYTGHFSKQTDMYLSSLPEVTVHMLRRIQVGDVPAVDNEAVPA